MVNAAKRSVEAVLGSIIKCTFLFIFCILVLDFQIESNAAPTVPVIRHSSRGSNRNVIRPRRRAGRQVRRPRYVDDGDEEDEDDYDDDYDYDDDMDSYEEPEYKELEFKPIGNEIPNPWEGYMDKFDIPRVHGSGIYVDLGKNGTYKNDKYRMVAGRCPVFGKVIEFSNGVDYLSPANDSATPGFGFPFTSSKGSNAAPIKTSKGRVSVNGNANQDLISPISAKTLRDYEYDGDDIYNCASYANELMMGSDMKSDYKYPFAYDMKSKTCHILYSSLQLIQGPNYCDQDGRNDRGGSSMPCIKPVKDIDQEMVYGSSFIHKDWKTKCPRAAVSDAVFGTWNGTACVPIQNKRVFRAATPEVCGQIVFRYSASDAPRGYETRRTDGSRIMSALSTFDLNAIGKIIMPATNSRAHHSKGKGFNWANYDREKRECGLIDEVPNCLVFKMGNIAFTALGSPLEEDMEKFPCNIRSYGYVTKGDPDDANGYILSTTHRDMLDNGKNVETLKAHSCEGYYGEFGGEVAEATSSTFSWSFNFNYMMVGAGICAVILVLLLILLRKVYKKKCNRDNESLINKYEEFEGKNYGGWEGDKNVDDNDDFWEKSQVRPSEVTPIRIERIEY